MAKEEEVLSALDIMMSHADDLFGGTVGAPKPRKPRARKRAPTVGDAMDLIPQSMRDQFEYGEDVILDPSSGRISRAVPQSRRQRDVMRAREEATDTAVGEIAKAITSTIGQAQSEMRSDFAPPKPVQQELDIALEELFRAQARDLGEILEAIEDNTKVSQKSAKLFEQWVEWEKNKAYKEQNRDKSDDHEMRSESQKDSAPDPKEGSSGPGLDDLLGGGKRKRKRKRPDKVYYGRKRGGTYADPPPATLPNGATNPDPRSRPKKHKKPLIGKYTRYGIAAALGGWVVGDIFKRRADKDHISSGNVDQNATQVDASATPVPDVPDPTAMPPVATPPATDVKKTPEVKGVPDGKYDPLVNAGLIGTTLLTPAKRLPVVGPALAVASGGYEASKVLSSDMSKEDKERALTKTAVSTGTTFGAAGIGAAVGGFLGSIVPIAGTAAGATIGSIIGGALGDYFGDSIGEYVATKIEDDTDEAKKEREQAQKTLQAGSNGGFLASLFGIGSAPGQQYMGGMLPAKPTRPGQSASQIAQNIQGMGIGAVSAFYESGNRGVGTISSGAGDAGGISYGRHQLSSTAGTMAAFLNSPEGKAYAQQFGGAMPGSPQFNQMYSQISQQDPEGFAKAQENFITRTHYGAQMSQLQKGGIDLSDKGRAVQEAVYSVSTQYGGQTDVIKSALAGKDINAMSQQDIVNAIQDYRRDSVNSRFKSSSQDTRDSVRQRAEDERATLLQIANADAKPAGASTEVKDVSAQVSQVSQPASVQPVPKPTPEVIPAPAATDLSDILGSLKSAQSPAPAAPTQAKPTKAPGQGASARTVLPPIERNGHSLDEIPVYINDPMMNMLNMGYI